MIGYGVEGDLEYVLCLGDRVENVSGYCLVGGGWGAGVVGDGAGGELG